jgi:hypothetical protein
MVCCERCSAWFKDSFNLKRHMSRKRQCENNNINIKKNTEPISTINEQISIINEQISIINEQISIIDEQNNKCGYCLNKFYNKSSLKRHQGICKLKNDPVRVLEIEQNIKPILPKNNLECRFCNVSFSRSDSLNKHLLICKKRKDYQENLERNKLTVINNNIVNNITNNNQVTNNVNVIVLSFGNESLEHINTEDIISDINNLISENSDSKNYILAGKLLTCFEERVKSIPENRNTSLRSIRSDYGEIKTESGIKKVKIKRFLDDCIKNTAKNFNKKKSEIKTKDHETKSILKEVNVYAEHGFQSEETEKEIEENILDYKYTLINN